MSSRPMCLSHSLRVSRDPLLALSGVSTPALALHGMLANLGSANMSNEKRPPVAAFHRVGPIACYLHCITASPPPVSLMLIFLNAKYVHNFEASIVAAVNI